MWKTAKMLKHEAALLVMSKFLFHRGEEWAMDEE
jgi:hypothetical protein